MPSNPQQPPNNSSSSSQTGVVLPSFRELFSEYVVPDAVNGRGRGATPRPTGNPSSLQNEPRADPGRQGIPTPSNSIPSSRIHNRPFVNEDALHSHGAAVPQHAQGGVLPSSSGQPQPPQPSVPPSEEKKHICAICGKGFARSSSLTTHYNSHTGERPFECSFPGCDSRFSVKSNMLRHLRTHNTTE